MKKENVKLLIEDLVANDLRPVNIKSQTLLVAQYFLVFAATAILLPLLLGFAPFSFTIRTEKFTSLIFFILAALQGAIWLAHYSRPGEGKISPLAKVLYSLDILALFLLQGIFWWLRPDLMIVGGPSIEMGWKCWLIGSISALAMALGVLFLLLRSEAPVKEGKAGACLLLLSFFCGGLVLLLHCPNFNPLHHLLWHLCLPLATLWPLTRFFLLPLMKSVTFPPR